MNRITSFFWICSGADRNLLQKCPTESSKYAGIGATIFFTGLFAAIAAGYALFTVFDHLGLATAFGLLWGLMIFNLDRYIVSSMRKEGRTKSELLMASPRLILAIIISIVIAKPLELKIFEKEIEPELVMMEQETYARQEKEFYARVNPSRDSLGRQIDILKKEIALKVLERNSRVRAAQEEADGTGGSKKKNLGPIYKIKKADADAVEKELQELSTRNNKRINELQDAVDRKDSLIAGEYNLLEKKKMNGPAARMEALDRISDKSSAIAWANWFIMLLFIAIEISPVLVKLMSPRGPYDNLLRQTEHEFKVQELESVTKQNAEAKEKASTLPTHEKNFLSDKLDASL
ncbi:DUF4407 domain-containing protein [Pseudochryseolinea flava]|uniref:DUF4407 domain-containing protein n=1 Tax=Pseudochryseolinea flava TaxID=2059302 RepID=A0A364XY74_9BACT|nr:DUF4407 domain-containing protein [Pseudochryseolinea flava]RAV98752.1 DUF4407 domain-containing protein [Pseudochryseolinea flava]